MHILLKKNGIYQVVLNISENKVQEPITTIQTREGSTPTIDETTDVTVTMSQTQDADLLAEIEEKNGG